MENPIKDAVKALHDFRWSIEVYHRELKQTCGIERCQVSTNRAQRNNICLSIIAWIKKQHRRLLKKLSFYKQDWDVIKSTITNKINSIMSIS